MPKLTRRAFAALSAATLALPLARPAAALTVGEARALVDRMVADIQDIIAGSMSEGQAISQFEGILQRYGDMPIIAQTVMGVDWRRATPAQRAAFTDAFQGYMARKYGRRFREFVGGTIEVVDASPLRSYFEVISTVRLAGSAPFEVRFHVSDGSGQNRFFNLVIEGVNLRTTERSEIGAILDRNGGDIDALVAALRQTG